MGPIAQSNQGTQSLRLFLPEEFDEIVWDQPRLSTQISHQKAAESEQRPQETRRLIQSPKTFQTFEENKSTHCVVHPPPPNSSSQDAARTGGWPIVIYLKVRECDYLPSELASLDFSHPIRTPEFHDLVGTCQFEARSSKELNGMS